MRRVIRIKVGSGNQSLQIEGLGQRALARGRPRARSIKLGDSAIGKAYVPVRYTVAVVVRTRNHKVCTYTVRIRALAGAGPCARSVDYNEGAVRLAKVSV